MSATASTSGLREARPAGAADDIAHTLESGRTQGVITPGSRIRRLTPRECLRLQGFTEGQIDKILAITSDSQAYAQAGNSVTSTSSTPWACVSRRWMTS